MSRLLRSVRVRRVMVSVVTSLHIISSFHFPSAIRPDVGRRRRRRRRPERESSVAPARHRDDTAPRRRLLTRYPDRLHALVALHAAELEELASYTTSALLCCSSDLPSDLHAASKRLRKDSGAMRARDSTRQAVRTAWGDRWPAATAVGSGDSRKSAGADAGAGRVGARHDETWKS